MRDGGTMRWLRRILIDTAAGVSLALFAGTMILWGRGFWLDENFSVSADSGDLGRNFSLWSYRNGFCVGGVWWEASNEDGAALASDLRQGGHWVSRPSGGAGWERGFGRPNVRWKLAGFAWLSQGRPDVPWYFF